MITEKDIINLKDEAQGIRDNIIKVKATYAEVVKNIETHEASLTELGINPKDVDNALSGIEEEIKLNYEAAKTIINNYKEAIQ